MADFKSDQRKAIDAVPMEFIKIADTNGRVRTSYAKFTSGEVLAQNDRILLFKLPAGCRVIQWASRSEAFGASVVMDLGTDATPARIADNVDIAAAGVDSGFSLSWDILPGQGGSEVSIYATLAGANPADNADLEVLVTWVLD